MTLSHGAPPDLAGPGNDRPLTYNDAQTVYQTSLTAARTRATGSGQRCASQAGRHLVATATPAGRPQPAAPRGQPPLLAACRRAAGRWPAGLAPRWGR